MTGILEGFEPTSQRELDAILRRTPVQPCGTRATLEAFLSSNEEAIAKPMATDELRRTLRALRSYQRAHLDEFGDIAIAQRRGRLVLSRKDLNALQG